MQILLNAAALKYDPQVSGPLPTIESPNCSDAIELRGRFDAEVLGPLIAASAAAPTELKAALEQYDVATNKIKAMIAKVAPDQRVSSMNSPPRKTRYEAMRTVYDCLYGGRGVASLAKLAGVDASRLDFSVVNLSYDYDDDDDELSLDELDRTACIVLGTALSYFEQSERRQRAASVVPP